MKYLICEDQRFLPSQPKMCEQSYLLTIGYGFWGALKNMSQGLGDMYDMCDIFKGKFHSLGKFWATKHTFTLAQENES